MTTTQPIALNRLVQSKANVRRTGQTSGIEALMASIAAHGLRQNLNVLPTTGGRFAVVAGGRRLIALKKLARAGTIDTDIAVPCLVLSAADNATEISLAENQLREAMHPDDQCAAFQSLIETGMPVEDVAARFGVSPAVVRQRLRLAAVSPKLRAAYRAGDTTLAHMMALTLSDDHAAQEAAFAACSYPEGIRRMLTQETVAMSSRLVAFVGLDAYRQAGGGVIEDLFEAQDSYLTDPALLHALAGAKLDEAAQAVAAEGWAWVSAELSRDWQTAYGRVQGERDEAGNITFTAAQMAEAGARVTLDYQGQVDIERGLLRRADMPEQTETTPKAPRSAYSAGLIRELTAHRTAALRLELSRRPDVALAATVHALVTACRNTHGSCSALQVTVKCRALAGVVDDMADCSAHAGMAAELERWNDRLPADSGALWEWLRLQDTETVLDVLATFAALTLDAVTDRADGGTTAPAGRLAAALDLDMATVWQPSPRFMGRLNKAVMAEALTETGQDSAAANVMLMKKDTAAAVAAAALRGSGWLPPVLRRPEAVAANDNAPVPAVVEAPAEDDVTEVTEQDEEAA